jgi:peptidoglycan/LPS O-acetylase OafA/YrhL
LKSSSGEHYIALDHLRALAAFLVFGWHFLHGTNGYPISFEYAPSVFLFSILDEGHTGVALFMVLSGYLFAKLLDGKKIQYSAFFLNRFLRLAPLLAFVLLVGGIAKYRAGGDVFSYAKGLATGLLFPNWPNGGWSITVELHFYLLLPLLLRLAHKSTWSLPGIIFAAVIFRYCIYLIVGEVQSFAYWTIVGRLDQFLLGMIAYRYRYVIKAKQVAVLSVLILFLLFYWYFDSRGGFTGFGEGRPFVGLPAWEFFPRPSTSKIWIVLPTLEGLAFALLVAYYDSRQAHAIGWVSRILGHIGTYSYSIYLFHFFFVFSMARFVHERVMDLTNFYVAAVWALLSFLMMVPLGYLSFRFIESPFLQYRKPYVLAR